MGFWHFFKTHHATHEISSSPARVDELRKSSEVRFSVCGRLDVVLWEKDRHSIASFHPESEYTFAIFLWYLVTLEVKVRWFSRFSFCFRRGSHKPSCATKNRSLASRSWSNVTDCFFWVMKGVSLSNKLALCQNWIYKQLKSAYHSTFT